ncbi:putative DNA replication ATP-dependent helicase/nuclease DNA2 [Paratrimastix pyriformis]|uniref:DNA replication ATP-dependent helicase/nuclease DNA2 n=1 Tax=Paratrimastix pyriformis TaxID=342808 RepID=A0ABQ8UMC6_9EUKA|nr:putative DNA replication ATP-dependent helicase/nuclease DNA2 [Paratrimastix pyriformis]
MPQVFGMLDHRNIEHSQSAISPVVASHAFLDPNATAHADLDASTIFAPSLRFLGPGPGGSHPVMGEEPPHQPIEFPVCFFVFRGYTIEILPVSIIGGWLKMIQEPAPMTRRVCLYDPDDCPEEEEANTVSWIASPVIKHEPKTPTARDDDLFEDALLSPEAPKTIIKQRQSLLTSFITVGRRSASLPPEAAPTTTHAPPAPASLFSPRSADANRRRLMSKLAGAAVATSQPPAAPGHVPGKPTSPHSPSSPKRPAAASPPQRLRKRSAQPLQQQQPARSASAPTVSKKAARSPASLAKRPIGTLLFEEPPILIDDEEACPPPPESATTTSARHKQPRLDAEEVPEAGDAEADPLDPAEAACPPGDSHHIAPPDTALPSQASAPPDCAPAGGPDTLLLSPPPDSLPPLTSACCPPQVPPPAVVLPATSEAAPSAAAAPARPVCIPAHRRGRRCLVLEVVPSLYERQAVAPAGAEGTAMGDQPQMWEAPRAELHSLTRWRQATLRLRGPWESARLDPGDVVMAVGTFHPADEPAPWRSGTPSAGGWWCVIDEDQGALVTHCDVLLTGTTVGESFLCRRKAVLNARVAVNPNHTLLARPEAALPSSSGAGQQQQLTILTGPPGSPPPPPAGSPAPPGQVPPLVGAALYGQLVHEVVEQALLTADFTEGSLGAAAARAVQEHIEQLYGADQSEATMLSRLMGVVPGPPPPLPVPARPLPLPQAHLTHIPLFLLPHHRIPAALQQWARQHFPAAVTVPTDPAVPPPRSSPPAALQRRPSGDPIRLRLGRAPSGPSLTATTTPAGPGNSNSNSSTFLRPAPGTAAAPAAGPGMLIGGEAVALAAPRIPLLMRGSGTGTILLRPAPQPPPGAAGAGGPAPLRPRPLPVVPDLRRATSGAPDEPPGLSPPPPLRIGAVLDVEDAVWCPMYGMKGRRAPPFASPPSLLRLVVPHGYEGPATPTSTSLLTALSQPPVSVPSARPPPSGKLDATVVLEGTPTGPSAPVPDQPATARGSAARSVGPLEWKSGAPSRRGPVQSHRAQVLLYALLVAHTYDVEPALGGLLVYLKAKSDRPPAGEAPGSPSAADIARATAFPMVPEPSLLRDLIMGRNALAPFFTAKEALALPPICEGPFCTGCSSLGPCMVLHKVLERGTAASSGIPAALWERLTGHIVLPEAPRGATGSVSPATQPPSSRLAAARPPATPQTPTAPGSASLSSSGSAMSSDSPGGGLLPAAISLSLSQPAPPAPGPVRSLLPPLPPGSGGSETAGQAVVALAGDRLVVYGAAGPSSAKYLRQWLELVSLEEAWSAARRHEREQQGQAMGGLELACCSLLGATPLACASSMTMGAALPSTEAPCAVMLFRRPAGPRAATEALADDADEDAGRPATVLGGADGLPLGCGDLVLVGIDAERAWTGPGGEAGHVPLDEQPALGGVALLSGTVLAVHVLSGTAAPPPPPGFLPPDEWDGLLQQPAEPPPADRWEWVVVVAAHELPCPNTRRHPPSITGSSSGSRAEDPVAARRIWWERRVGLRGGDEPQPANQAEAAAGAPKPEAGAGTGAAGDSGTFVRMRYRLDRDDHPSAMGFASMRANLLQMYGADPCATALRRLLVDLAPPRFGPRPAWVPTGTPPLRRERPPQDQMRDGGPEMPPSVWHSLNSNQLEAVAKVVSAEDYVLVLGMPGAGKTTTIACMIDVLTRRGMSVLLAAFTHTAVDNVLLKLHARTSSDPSSQMRLLRLGHLGSIHPDLHRYALEGHLLETPPQARTVAAYGRWIDQATVVGTTCAAAGLHPLFGKRRFDWCIVDEASQVGAGVWCGWPAPGPAPDHHRVSFMEELTQSPLSSAHGCLQVTQAGVLGALLCARRFVLVGDHNQLPPLVQCPDARDQGMSVSLFKRLCDAHPTATATLRAQYRMCGPLAALANRLVYNGLLLCGSADVTRGRLDPPRDPQPPPAWPALGVLAPTWIGAVLDPALPLLFLNTDPLGPAAYDALTAPSPAAACPGSPQRPMSPSAPAAGASQQVRGAEGTDQAKDKEKEKDKGRGTPLNRLEATLAAQCVRVLLGYGALACPADIGVMSPYRAHCALVRRLLAVPAPAPAGPESAPQQADADRTPPLLKRRSTDPAEDPDGLLLAPADPDPLPPPGRAGGDAPEAVEVHTVDKFQGREKRCVVFCFVRSNTTGAVGDLLQDWRRLNVALTRARHKLILVGSWRTISRGGPFLQALLEAVKRWGRIVDLAPDAATRFPDFQRGSPGQTPGTTTVSSSRAPASDRPAWGQAAVPSVLHRPPGWPPQPPQASAIFPARAPARLLLGAIAPPGRRPRAIRARAAAPHPGRQVGAGQAAHTAAEGGPNLAPRTAPCSPPGRTHAHVRASAYPGPYPCVRAAAGGGRL